MPPDTPRVAEPIGTPLPNSVPITVTGTEGALIFFAVVTMIFIASLFLLGVWFFLNRLKREQEATARAEGRESLGTGTGSKPDQPAPGRDFTPQAEVPNLE